MQARRHTQKTAGARARMGAAAMELRWKSARPWAPKNIRQEPMSPSAKKSQMAVRKILRFSFSRPRAWAWLVSLEMARGRPAVETVKRTL